MSYRSLLLSGLLMSLTSLPLPAQAQISNSLNYKQPMKLALNQQLNPQIVRAYNRISAGIESKNINQVFAYAAPEYIWTETNGRTRNLQQTIQETSVFLQNTNNIKFRIKVSSISYSEPFATVSGTVYLSGFDRQANSSYSLERKFQDTWQGTGSGWTWISQRDLSQNIAFSKPRQRGNSTRQEQFRLELRQAFTSAQTAIDLCYEKKDLEECRRLNRIQLTLSTWCSQGDQQACIMGNNVQGLLNIEFRRQAAKQAYE
jgi:hypothetical protein